MDAQRIAGALREIAEWLEFEDEASKFRARAYRSGADAIEGEQDLGALVRTKTLTELAGIGDKMAAQVTELYETGTSSTLERLRGARPVGLLEVKAASGLSAPKVLALHEALGISDLASLNEAIAAHRVRDVKGFSEKAEAKIATMIGKYVSRGNAVIRAEALPIAEQVVAYMAPVRVEYAGALRRGTETLDSLEFVAESDDATAVLAKFLAFPRHAKTDARDDHSATVRLAGGLKASLVVADHRHFGSTLFRATGSDEHVRAVGVSGDFADEAALYRAAKLPVIPPELREGATIDTGDDLLELADVRGMVHCHTVYSDGKDTILDMARAAEARGFAYITITDHSPTAHYARGVELDRLRRQWDEIASVQESVKIVLLRGTESDITRDGALDYPDEILDQLDVVIASIHSRHQLDRTQMTERIVRAMRHPLFKIWGHALGRLLLEREPFECDIDEVFAAISESRAAIEVNGDPHRIDLPPALIPRARALGIKFVVSVDAHSTKALDYLQYGVTAARRGGLRRGEVLNTLAADAFARAVKPAQNARA